MNNLPFDPDDPRLTAYALGELPAGPDRDTVETWLSQSPDARAALEEIRFVTVLLASEYEEQRTAEESIGLNNAPGVRERIIAFPAATSSSERWWNDPVLKIAAVVVLLMTLGVLLLPHVLSNRRLDAIAASALTSGGSTPSGDKPAQSVGKMGLNVRTEEAPAAAPTTLLAEGNMATPGASVAAATPFVLALQKSDPDASVAPALSAKLKLDASERFALPSSAPGAPLPSAPLLAKAAPPSSVSSQTATLSGNGQTFKGYRTNQVSLSSLGSAAGNGGALAQNTPAQPLEYALKDQTSRSVARRASFLDDSDDNEVDRRSKSTDRSSALNTAAYDQITENPFLSARENPLSTFSIDVDTASYANVRRFIDSGSLPPAGAVRIEELLNYFPFSDAPPAEGNPYPFALHLEAAACPWNTSHRLVRIGIKGREMARDHRPPSNLVFLLDVSGSMEPADRLPLIKESLRGLVEQLGDDDRVAVVVYAGNSGLALPSTRGNDKSKIIAALDRLEAGGSTNGASGIQLAYQVAREHFIKGGVNRVILATDGDFNVGVTDQRDLVHLIETEAKSGVFLSALGVGDDNYKDSTMQKLADRGNGNYAYIDRLEEGRKVLVEQMTGTLVTIAKDVKIQVEFNPAAVGSYRLIGYEKRMLRKEDFNDDKVDAGEIGAGHSVTALYEIIPTGQTEGEGVAVDQLKYQPNRSAVTAAATGANNGELLTLKMRYKLPEANASERAYEESLTDHPAPNDFAAASADFRFSAAVAGFGSVLRDSPYRGNINLTTVGEIATGSEGNDPGGYRAQFVELVHKARTISNR